MADNAQADKPATPLELVKYPLLVASIVLGIIVLRQCAGISFGVVTEVGTQGIKFTQESQATLNSLTQTETRVNELDVRLKELEKAKASVNPDRTVASELADASQTVSDTTARLATLREAAGTTPTRGYIWIGNYDGVWKRATLGRIDTGQPIDMRPEQIAAGARYRLLRNMALRGELPSGDDDNLHGRGSVGVLPRDETVSIVSAPVKIERHSATQYWAQVERVASVAK